MLYILLLTIYSLVSSQSPQNELSTDDSETPNRPATFVNNFLSDLGDFILDVDETIYKITAPKDKFENNNKKQLMDTKTDKTREENYFDRARRNYKNLQERIRQSLNAPGDIVKMPELVNLNFQNKGQKSFLDLSLPFISSNVQVKAKSLSPKPEKEGIMDEKTGIFPNIPKLEFPFPDVTGSITIGGEKTNPKSSTKNSKDLSSEKQIDENPEFQKRSSRQPILKKEVPQRKIYLSSDINEDIESPDYSSSDLSGAIEELEAFKTLETEPQVEGRILGDLLFSESTFDKYFRRVLKDHKWLVDPKIPQPVNKIIENIRGVTRNNLKENVPQTKKRTVQQNTFQVSSKFPLDSKLDNDPLNIVSKNRQNQFLNLDYSHERKSVILAFTPEGIPLKLKINPYRSRPLDFLNEILNSAGVSLNIPINSHRGIQPAGNDILQLGVTSEMPAHAVYIDLSDNRQLKSFLRTLQRFRYSN